MRLKDKVALITGSSRGVGRAIALAYAKEGAKVVVNYTSNQKAADEVVEAIKGFGSDAIGVKADVAKADEAVKLVQSAIDTFGRLDVLVNNAGFTRPAMLLKMTEQEWDEVLDIHLKGTFL
ncbi:MAG: SDR family NAD(P)-dependent oxidoreductase, partial [Desulfatiglandales bacterium]